ncbi:MAG: hypothetical protein SPK65_06265, partial [Succinivibrio dextrinosolvens]|nr:hypothetical protein [Succinivibrio dextrinosolvens]
SSSSSADAVVINVRIEIAANIFFIIRNYPIEQIERYHLNDSFKIINVGFRIYELIAFFSKK